MLSETLNEYWENQVACAETLEQLFPKYRWKHFQSNQRFYGENQGFYLDIGPSSANLMWKTPTASVSIFKHTYHGLSSEAIEEFRLQLDEFLKQI